MHKVSRTGYAFREHSDWNKRTSFNMKEFILCFAYIKMFALCLLPGRWVDLYCKHTLLLRSVCNFHFHKNSCSCAQLTFIKLVPRPILNRKD